MKALLSRLNIDPYIAGILGMVALASALPAEGRGMAVASDAGVGDDRADVLPAGRAAGAAGGAGRRAALAAACGGARQHVRAVPGAGADRAGDCAGAADAAAVGRAADAVRAAVDGAVLDRLHLDRPRQRAGGAVRGDRVEPARHPADAAAGRAAAERARRLLGARRGRHRGAASAAVRRRPACAALDRRMGRPQQAAGPAWSIAARSCSWSTSRSARA